jgi:carbon monoxide dehydrogenase subunit G
MKLEGEHVFKGPSQAVWDMFLDPEVLSGALPGQSKFTKVSETEYEGFINIKIGPVSGNFSGKMNLTDVNEPVSCTLNVTGNGIAGFAKGVGKIHLTDQGDDSTLLKYTGELNIGGTLASVGQRMLDSVSKNMIRQGFESLDKVLETRLSK